jgi:hypothetical protein
MFHGRNDLGQRVIGGVDLVIDFATLGEYGLEPFRADGSCRERTNRRSRTSRRPGWEALATTRRRACGAGAGTNRRGEPATEWRFPRTGPSRANFRAALDRYAT